jgi:hypothetical protein
MTPLVLVHRNGYRGVVETFQRKRHTTKILHTVADFHDLLIYFLSYVIYYEH